VEKPNQGSRSRIYMITMVIAVIWQPAGLTGTVHYMPNDKAPPKKGPDMATSLPARRKSAEDDLLDSFAEIVDKAAENMSDQDFKKAEKKSNEILDRALADHSRRRGTA
jgi:hypothetical protein